MKQSHQVQVFMAAFIWSLLAEDQHWTSLISPVITKGFLLHSYSSKKWQLHQS